MTNNSPEQSSSTLADQNRTLFKQLPLILLVNVPLVLALAWLYWPRVDHRGILTWAGCMFFIMLLRVIMLMIYRGLVAQGKMQPWQMQIFAANSALSGIMWGWSGVLFFVPERLDFQLIILLVLIVKGVGSVSAVTSFLPAFYVYFPASLLPISVMFMRHGDVASLLLGILVLVFVIAMLIFGKNLNRTLVESLRLRHENDHLLIEAEQQRQQAEQANAAKSRFLAAASHDLRQPIHALNLFNSVLAQTITAEPEARIIAQSRNTLNTLHHLLDALLDVSKLEAGVVKADIKPLPLQRVLSRLANDFAPLAAEKNLTLLWPMPSLAVYADEDLLEQVLRNLFANAIRYTDTGSVEIKAIELPQHVRIEVIDTGIGIAEDQQTAIFSEFYQAENAHRERHQGLGLGLAIVDRVIRLLDSRIYLESKPGKGSRFYFDLPKCNIVDTESLPTKAAMPTALDSFDFTVAILEDDPEVGQAMSSLLESWGCKTLVATDGDVILNVLSTRAETPAIIISDLHLANGHSGIEAIHRIQQHMGTVVPAMIITADTTSKDLKEVREAALPVLHKPVAPAKLRALIRNLLTSR